MEKITKKEKFEMLKGLAVEAGEEMLVEFCEAEITRLVNKKATPTKAQKMNVELANIAYKILVEIGEAVNVADFMTRATELEEAVIEAGANFSNQKVTAIMKVLVADGRAVKTSDKKKTFYTAVVD